jgi:hypothetical protein
MSFDAVVLLRIPGFTPPDDLDVRELEDGFLLFLDVSIESGPDAIMGAVYEAIGDALGGHDDDRGLFILPDAAEPEDASTYDDVIAAVGSKGAFLSAVLDEDEGDGDGAADFDPQDLAKAAQGMLGQMLESMGAGSMEDLARALETGDKDALKLAQVRMMGAMERTMAGSQQDVIDVEADGDATGAPKLGAGAAPGPKKSGG